MPDVNEIKVILNGHEVVGWWEDEDDAFNTVPCPMEFDVKADAPGAIKFGQTHFQCTRMYGHDGRCRVNAGGMEYEATVTFDGKEWTG